MKHISIIIVATLALAGIFSSCKKEPAPFLELSSAKEIAFTMQGGSQIISFTTNRDWTINASESWCKATPPSGVAASDDISVTIVCEPNPNYDHRTATLTIKAEELTETITVTQETNLGLIASPTTFDLTNAEQTIEVEVQQNVNYTVEIDEACNDWITKVGTKALTTERVVFNIAANTTYDNREGTITFKQTDGDLEQTVTVKQSQTNGLFITTPEYDLSNEAHTLTVEVKANVEFEVTSEAEWIKYESASTKALTPSQITLHVDANGTYDDREGSVIVQQKGGDLTGTITIRQDENYGIFVSKESISIDKEEQSVEVEVKYNVEFDVVIPENAMGAMITTIEYDDGGTGTKALSTRKYRLGISENKDYDPREVSITFKQKDGSLSGTFTISQAQKDGLIIGQTLFEVGRNGETIEIPLQTNIEYDVIIPEEAKEWIKRVDSAPTKSLVNKSVCLEVAENATYFNREASVVIKKKDGDLSETIEIKQAQTDALFITGENKAFNISSKGGVLKINIFHNIPFEVDKTDLPDWIAITIEDKDTYNSTLTITVENNSLYKGRDVSITIKGGVLSDVLTINEHQVDIVYTDISEYKAGWKGGDFSIKIYSNVNYTLSLPEWITEKSKQTDTEGDLSVDTIICSVVENLDAEREGIIAFSWRNEGIMATTRVPIKQVSCTFESTEAGTIKDYLNSLQISKIRVLTILGPINGTDVLLIRRMTQLRTLDMGEARIVCGGSDYFGGNYTEDDVLGSAFFYEMKSLENVIIPKGIKKIQNTVFYDCTSLKTVTIFDKVEEIGEQVFYNCPLDSITLPNSLKVIRNAAFSSSHIKSVTLPNSLVTIGMNAFYQCGYLETISLPKSIQSINHYAFAECYSLKEIHIQSTPDTLTYIGVDIFRGGTGRENIIYQNAILYIPKGTRDAYYLTDLGRFINIIEE